jgi:hypothetical protein
MMHYNFEEMIAYTSRDETVVRGDLVRSGGRPWFCPLLQAVAKITPKSGGSSPFHPFLQPLGRLVHANVDRRARKLILPEKAEGFCPAQRPWGS